VSDVVVTAARPDGAAVAEAIARAEEVTRGVRA
jgi:hypothetical protein